MAINEKVEKRISIDPARGCCIVKILTGAVA